MRPNDNARPVGSGAGDQAAAAGLVVAILGRGSEGCAFRGTAAGAAS
jgi:hypothetical protein